MKRLLIVLFCFCLQLIQAADAPIAVYVCLADHPEHNMYIQWIADKEDFPHDFHYRANGDTRWQDAQSDSRIIPDGSGLFCHRVLLQNLQDETIYTFKVGANAKEYHFRTLPAQFTAPLRFIDGGDVHHDELSYVRTMSKQAAAQNPHFITFGGDLTYYKCRMDSHNPLPRWLGFVKSLEMDLVDSTGCMIPIVTCIGNHDIQFNSADPYSCAPFFHTLFPTPGHQGYQVIDIGDYYSLFLLDSGHSNTVWGLQAKWLSEALPERKQRPFLFAQYHIPAYPSVRRFETKVPAAIRLFWVPLFEKNNIIAAFEHHDHAYKRTYPIKNNKRDPHGIIYLGDGAWGVKNPRTPAQADKKWYLACTAKKRNFHLVILDKNHIEFKGYGDDGVCFDDFTWKRQEPVALNESE